MGAYDNGIKDQIVEHPNRFIINGVPGQTIEPDFGQVLSIGTPTNRDLITTLLAAMGPTSGSASALTLAQEGFSLFDGAVVRVKLHVDMAAGATLNVNGTGTKGIVLASGSLVPASAKAGTWLTLTYSSSLDAYIATVDRANAVMIVGEYIPTVLGSLKKPAATSQGGGEIYYGGNGVFFSVYNGNAIYTTDGINWRVAAPKPSSTWTVDPVVGDDTIVSFSSGASNQAVVYLSATNGRSWQSFNVSGFFSPNRPIYVNGGFYASTADINTGQSEKIAYSLDGGLSWGIATLPTINGFPLFPLLYGNGVFLAVRQKTSNNNWYREAAYSTDGITWLPVTLPDLWRAVNPVFHGGFFAIGSEATERLAYSADGTSWAMATLPFSDGIAARGHAGGKVFIKSTATSKTFCSSDYVEWEETDLSVNNSPLNIQFKNGRYFTNNGLVTATSIDGVTWQAGTMPALTNLRPVTISENGYFVSTYNTNRAAYSEDGLTWVLLTMPSEASWERFADINGVVVSLDSLNTDKIAVFVKQSVLADVTGRVVYLGGQNVLYP